MDLVHGVGCKVYHAELNIESASRISGSRSTHGWAADKQCLFRHRVFPTSRVDTSPGGWQRTSASAGDELSGEQIKAIFS